MADLSFSIYQNHTLDSLIDVATHYITLKADGTFTSVSDPDSGNAVFFSCRDKTNDRKWLTVEMHLKDDNVHGSFMIYNSSARKSYSLPPKEVITQHLKAVIDGVKKEKQDLFS